MKDQKPNPPKYTPPVEGAFRRPSSTQNHQGGQGNHGTPKGRAEPMEQIGQPFNVPFFHFRKIQVYPKRRLHVPGCPRFQIVGPDRLPVRGFQGDFSLLLSEGQKFTIVNPAESQMVDDAQQVPQRHRSQERRSGRSYTKKGFDRIDLEFIPKTPKKQKTRLQEAQKPRKDMP